MWGSWFPCSLKLAPAASLAGGPGIASHQPAGLLFTVCRDCKASSLNMGCGGQTKTKGGLECRPTGWKHGCVSPASKEVSYSPCFLDKLCWLVLICLFFFFFNLCLCFFHFNFWNYVWSKEEVDPWTHLDLDNRVLARSWDIWVPISVSPLTHCVTLEKLLSSSGLPFPHR